MVRLIIASLLISNIAIGADLQTIYLPSGQPAPFSGYLFTPSDAAQAATNKEANAIYKQMNQSLQTSLDLETKSKQDSDAKNAILNTDLTNTTKALQDEKTLTTWEKVLWFGLGAFTAYGAIRLGSQVNNH